MHTILKIVKKKMCNNGTTNFGFYYQTKKMGEKKKGLNMTVLFLNVTYDKIEKLRKQNNFTLRFYL